MLTRKFLLAATAIQIILFAVSQPSSASDARELIQKGNKAVQEKNYSKAVKEYEAAIKADPKSTEAHLLAGLTYSKLGDATKAVDYIQTSIGIEPSFGAWRSLGLIYADKAALDKAKEAYKKALEISPDSFQAWYEMGLLQSSSGNFAEAVSCYERAIALNSRLGNAYLGMGAAYYWLGDKNSAVKQAAALKMIGMNDMAQQLENWIKNKDQKKQASKPQEVKAEEAAATETPLTEPATTAQVPAEITA